jgi:hypothetical protein
MFEMRNYAQHCGEVPLQGQIHHAAAANRLDLSFDRDRLLADFSKWKNVKADLTSGPERIGVDVPVEEAMTGVTRLATKVAELDQPRFAACLDTIRKTTGSHPQNTNQRRAVFRTRPGTDDGGQPTMEMAFGPVVVVEDGATDGGETMEVPDFRDDRPATTTVRSTRSCQGPMNKVTHLPAETCTERATMSFLFPHQQGLALAFACEPHAVGLGRWLGKKFGGTYGGEAEKASVILQMAADQGTRVDEPHGAEFDQLLPAPNPPKAHNPFDPSTWGTSPQTTPTDKDPG